MNNLKVIKTFKDINFDTNYRPLVICDIDHTFIREKFDVNYFSKNLFLILKKKMVKIML